MVGSRDTPPSVQDGPFGWEPNQVSAFEDKPQDKGRKLDDATAMTLGREAWESSTNWLNSGRRARWNDSLRAFQNLHPSGSKYLSGDYRYRSTLFRPKTRAMVRRDEAATAAAFFSNEDVVSITATNDDDPKQQASAAILSQLLQFRLTKTVPWFLTLVGARQDAEVLGICVAKAGWEYEERYLRSEKRPKLDQNGQPLWDEDARDIQIEDVDLYQVAKDRPFINLIAPENFRFEPGCDWRNPVESSPYLIEMDPVYIGEALERMESHHGAPPEWLAIPESALHAATDLADDVTRRSREAGRVPGKDHDAWKPAHYDLCWTRMNIVRYGGEDWCFRTLAGSGALLEPPRPIREVHLHGLRPYVVGSVVVETHKTYPTSKVELVNDLQRAANQDWNARFDNVMLSLQPRQFVKEGAGQDINDLRTFVPGKVVSINSGKEPITNVVTWDRPPPVDAAAYQEQDRINLDWDDLAGSFTNSSVRSSEVSDQSATGMNLMSGEASGLNEYELRLFAETFVEPLLRLFIKLEQAYETDPEVLAMAGQNAKLFQKFGIDQITDELLEQELTTKVNVGIGATNPQLKLRNFATGAQILGSIFGPAAAQGANFQEVSKEVFGLLGYKDGARFFQPNFDPRVAMLQQQLQKLQGKSQGQGGETPAATAAKIQVANINAQSKARSDEMRAQTDRQNAELDFRTQHMEEEYETRREMIRLQAEQQKQAVDHMHDHQMGAVQRQHEAAMGVVQQQHETQMGMHQQAHEQQMGQQAAWQKQSAQGPSSSSIGKSPKAGAGTIPNSPGTAPPPNMPPSSGPMATGSPPMPMAIPNSGPPMGSAPPASSTSPNSDLTPLVHGFQGGIQQLMQHMQQGHQQMADGQTQMMGQFMQAMMQQMQQSNEHIASAMAQIAQMVAGAAEKSEAANQALVAALQRKKRIVRGMDGRVEGLE